jgi:sugar lactone lactonase YvrE
MHDLEAPFLCLGNTLVDGNFSLRKMGLVAAFCGLLAFQPGFLCLGAVAETTAHLIRAESIIGNGLDHPSGIAVDKSGNLYIADTGNGRVLKETLSGGNYTQSIVVSGLSQPEGIAVDGSGNLYIADTGNNRVLKEILSGGSYTQILIANNLNQPEGVAVDGSDNLYIADTGNGRVWKETLSGGNYTQSSVASLPQPLGVAVDGNGNVYISIDGGAVKETLSAGSYTLSTIQTSMTLSSPGIAVDGSGTIYIAGTNSLGGQVLKETPMAGGYSETVLAGEAANGMTDPYGIAVDGNGNVYFADVSNNRIVQEISVGETSAAGSFGQVTLGNTATLTLSFTFDTGGTVGSLALLTQGAPGLDFLDTGTGTCKSNTAYFAGATCTVSATFKPTRPGLRYGAVELLDTSGNLMASGNVQGTGLGSQLAFLPGLQSMIGSGLSLPRGVAVDGYGNVYIADTSNNRVLKETLLAGAYTQSTIGSGISQPTGVAVDGSGNVYISGDGGFVWKETLSAGSYFQSMIENSVTLTQSAIAVDASGNIYLAGSDPIGSARVIKETLSASGYSETTIINQSQANGNPSYLYGIAVDMSGNIYIADFSSSVVSKLAMSSGSYFAQSTITTVFQPYGVAVDGSGNVYISGITNSGTSSVLKETPLSGGYAETRLFNLSNLEGTVHALTGVAVDRNGNVYAADGTYNQVLKEDLADPPSLSFASTSVGSTSSDSPQTITVMNIGNAALTFPVLTSGNDPSISANFDLSSSTTCPQIGSSSLATGTLAAGASCVYSILFIPESAGSISGSLVLTDNSLNANSPYATQSISLNGNGSTATLSAASLTFASQTEATTSSAQAVTLTNTGTAALTITSIAASGDFAQTDTCGTSVAAGTMCTISVTFTPTAAGLRTGTLTITDNASGSPQTVALSGSGAASGVAAPVVTLSPTSLTFAAQTDGTASAAQTVTLTNSGVALLAITSITASGDFSQTNTCGTSVAAGANCAISVTFTPTAAGNRTGTLTITDNVSGSPQTVALSGGGEAVSITSSSTGLTIASAGGSATATISLSPQGGFMGTVNLKCAVSYQGQGTPNSPPTCSLSPSQAQVTGTSSVSSTLTVSTTTASATAALDRQWKGTGFALAALIFLGILPRRRWRGGLLAAVLSLVAIGGVIGCSGSNGGGTNSTSPSPSGTTTGNYQVMVTATSGTATASTTIPLSLQ